MPDGSMAARQTVCWDAGPTVEPPLLGALKFVPLEKRCLGCFGPEKLDMFNNMFNNMSDILIIPIIIVRYYWSSQYVPNYWLVICQWLSHCSGEFDTGVPRGPSAGGMDQQLSVAGVVPWLTWNLLGLSFRNTQERQGAWSSILVGGLEHEFYFPIYWVSNHPNWLIFFRGVQTTNQYNFPGNILNC